MWIAVGGLFGAVGSEAHASPTRLWSTYYGGSDFEDPSDVAFDSDENVIHVGGSKSSTGIAGHAPGFTTFDPSLSGDYDAYVAQFDVQGNRLWGTYYGGSGSDRFSSLAVDTSDNILALGSSESSSMATLGTLSLSGPRDGLLAKFNTTGGLTWARYIGGSGKDGGSGVCVSTGGTIYVVGSTNSTTGLAVNTAEGTAKAGSTDAFIAKVTSAGTLVWARYYGGNNGSTSAFDCVVDSLNNVYVAGVTSASIGISANGYDNVYSGGEDAFVAKFSTNGLLLWGSYYGGSARDSASAIDLDDDRNVYFAGTTRSANGANIIDSFGTARTDEEDAFVVRLNRVENEAQCGPRLWGRYVGGFADDSVNSEGFTDLEVSGNAVMLSGYTNSEDGIATPDAFQGVYLDWNDAMFVALDSSDGDMFYGTYIGGVDLEDGQSGEHGMGVAANFNKVALVGTANGDGLASHGAWDDTYDSMNDAWIFLFEMFAF